MSYAKIATMAVELCLDARPPSVLLPSAPTCATVWMHPPPPPPPSVLLPSAPTCATVPNSDEGVRQDAWTPICAAAVSAHSVNQPARSWSVAWHLEWHQQMS